MEVVSAGTTAMKDPILETKLRLLGLQIESWKKLHDFITYALDKGKPIISAGPGKAVYRGAAASSCRRAEYVFDELGLLAELSGKAMNVLQRVASLRGGRAISRTEDARRMEAD